jgi:ZIP family zinc transporter
MTGEILRVIGLALLPGLGNLGGGLLAEWLDPSRRTVNRALHAATGTMLAVIAVKVMPAALGAAPAWLLALAFFAGGGVHLLVEGEIERWQEGKEASDAAGARAWMVYLAVATDLVGDGLLIGAGSAVSGELALLLAFGQVMADVPEGFAVIANFRDKGVGEVRRLLLAASFVVPVVGAAVLAYFVLRERHAAIKVAVLAFVAGLYMLAAVEDMLGEAHESVEDTRWSAISFLAGFSLFLVVSGGLG